MAITIHSAPNNYYALNHPIKALPNERNFCHLTEAPIFSLIHTYYVLNVACIIAKINYPQTTDFRYYYDTSETKLKAKNGKA